MDNSWQHLGAVDPLELVAARHELHYAAQAVSAVGRTWLSKKDDDSHTNLGWAPALGRLVGRTAGDPPLRAALDLAGLRLSLLDAAGKTVAEFALEGRTVGDAQDWLKGRLAAVWGRELDAIQPLHYEMPEHELGSGGSFSAPDEGCAELERWFDNAASVLERVRAEHGSSAVRCWPHHFDIATLISLEGERSIGVGMSPGDGSYPEPYWYVGPWPHPKPETWPELPAGRWHTDGFVAAVLTGSELVKQAGQQAYVDDFLQAGVSASRALLSAD